MSQENSDLQDKADVAESHGLVNSAVRLGSYTSLFVASQIADRKNILNIFFPGMFDTNTDSKPAKAKKPITNPGVRGRKYASGVNPLTGAIWGPGNAMNIVTSLGMLFNGNVPDGLRFLWESTTNLATYVSAHKKLAAQKAKQGGILTPYWYQAIAKLVQNDRRGYKQVLQARKAANGGNLSPWDLAIAKLARKDLFISAANFAPRFSPASGAIFSGLSLLGRFDRPDSWVNTAAMYGDVTALTGNSLLLWAQSKEKFFKKHRLWKQLLPWMVRGGMAAWLAQIPGRMGDLYQTGVLLEQAGNVAPKRYHGPQSWLTTMGNSYVDDPSRAARDVSQLVPETGNMLYMHVLQSLMGGSSDP